jgi:PAS domain S-box-containing protein
MGVHPGPPGADPAHPAFIQLQRAGYRQWWIWGAGALATIVIVLQTSSLFFSGSAPLNPSIYTDTLKWSMRGLVALLLLAGIYGAYQQVHTFRLRHRLLEAEKLFYLIGDSGSDLIAIVDTDGRRLYNSPSYEKVLGYTSDDLKDTSGLDQIHPEDRAQVIAAAEEAQRTGVGRRLEYRIRHHDGSWRIFESTCSAVRDHRGEIDKLIIVNRDITAQVSPTTSTTS